MCFWLKPFDQLLANFLPNRLPKAKSAKEDINLELIINSNKRGCCNNSNNVSILNKESYILQKQKLVCCVISMAKDYIFLIKNTPHFSSDIKLL